MNYSIIIPSYNSETTILKCLDALSLQEFNEAYEIIVVDSSSDTTPDLIRQHYPQVKLIHFTQRTDAGTARNIGIQQAYGEILCLIDSDCLAASDWLQKIAAAHEGNNYAAVGGAVLNANPESLVGWAGYFAEFREFFPFQLPQVTPHLATCNIAYTRQVFEQYGTFPSDFYPQEDLVFHLNIASRGGSILFDPAIQVAHTNRTAIQDFFKHQFRIGCITSQVLRAFPTLAGSRIARSRLMTLFAAPFLPIVKFFKTFRVAAMSQIYLRSFLPAAPLLFIGLLIFWSSGFVRGAFLPPHVSRQ